MGDPPGGHPSPVAARTGRPRWRDPRLAIGVVIVAGCAVLGGRVLAGADDTVSVWSARAPLTPGQPVTSDDLVATRVRFADQAEADRYVSAGTAPAQGVVLRRAVGTGELVPRSALGPAASGNLTEVPLSVDADAVPATMGRGSVVDVWVTAGSPGADPADDRESTVPGKATLVFDDVTVVSLPGERSSLGPATTRQVIVGVDQTQQSRLATSIAALASGDVVLTGQR